MATIIGTDGDNVIDGTASDDNLFGFFGDDLLTGEGGDDLIVSGDGNDTLVGGDGNDTLFIGTAADPDFLEHGDDLMDGGDGFDTVDVCGVPSVTEVDGTFVSAAVTPAEGGVALTLGATSEDSCILSQRAADATNLPIIIQGGDISFPVTLDTFLGAPIITNVEKFHFTNFSDIFRGNGTDYVVDMAGGDDLVFARAGAESITGGAGFDWVSYEDSTAKVSVSLLGTGLQSGGFAAGDRLVGVEAVAGSRFDDSLTGGTAGDTLAGRDGNDTLTDFGGNDRLLGGAGNDLLIGGLDDDTLDGGDGTDTASYFFNGHSVVVTLGERNLVTNPSGAGQALELTIDTDPSATPPASQVASTDTLFNVENVVGSTHDDILTGNSSANQLFGRDGDDLLRGGHGDDTLDGGAGTDTADYSTAPLLEHVVVDLGAGTADQAQLQFQLGQIHIVNVGHDTLSGIENVTGSGGGDTLIGNSGVNLLQGLGGDDLLRGGAGLDHLDGGAGVDTADYSDKTAAVRIALDDQGGAKVAVGGLLEDTIINIENLTGGEASDTLTGNKFANVLDGGGAADTMSGQGGDDTYLVDRAEDRVFEGANSGNDRVLASVSYTLGAGQSIENLAPTSLAGTSNINLTGNTLAQSITGNAGNNLISDGGAGGADVMNGLAGDDAYIVNNAGDVVGEVANQGSDHVLASVSYALLAGASIENLTPTSFGTTTNINLTGNELAQSITGNAGDNLINDGGAGGADVMKGLVGNDTYIVHNAGDVVAEAANQGSDHVLASVSYTLLAGASIENLTPTSFGTTTNINLTGNALAQTITGNAGDNVLNDGGAGGADTMSGLGGNDAYIVNNASDLVLEIAGAGNDRVLTSVSYTLTAGAEIENFNPTSFTGTTAINLTGNTFAQTIIGNAGANVINGAGGNDTLEGLGGNDTFVFNTALNAATNVDTILDFAHGADQIELDHAIFTALAAANPLPAADFTTGAPTNASQHILYNAATGALSYDDDGSGAHAAVQFATLSTHPALTNADIFVV
jgi:serralysin